jgi:hypothetical protein
MLASLRAATTPNPSRKGGQRLAPLGVAQTVSPQASQGLGATAQQLALPGGTDVVEHKLGGAARRIEADALVVSLDQIPLRGQRQAARGATLPDASVEAGGVVGERQIDVPRGAMHADLRNLALDPTVAQTAQGPVDAPRHLGH